MGLSNDERIKSMVGLKDVRVVAGGLDHPEAVTTGPDGMLYAGGWHGQIYVIDPVAGTVKERANIGGVVLGLVVDADGVIYACDVMQGRVVAVFPDATVQVWSTSAGGGKYRVPNYLAFDADGFLWLTDSGPEDPENPTGRIIRIPHGGGDGEVMSEEPLNFPNGLCIGADGEVYFVESFGHGVSRLVNGRAELVGRLEGVTPDGIAVDADGTIIVSCYYPFRLLSMDASSGEVSTLLDDPIGTTLRMPTNVSHFGEGLTSLAISNLAGDKILSIEPGVAGLALHYPNSHSTRRSSR